LAQANLDYILLDYSFAYKNDKVAPYISYAVFLDTPLDIAMARRIIRDMSAFIAGSARSIRYD
jgi:uridine kinase